jgi:quercetin dioxygenase-like cupin family protein
VEIKRIEFRPSQSTGIHLHPSPVVGLVIKGSVLFQIEGEAARVVNAGEAFFEPANTRILRFDAQEQGATFAACYLLGPDDRELIKMLE